MGWKSVDMQIAISRTVEASNIQQQMTKHHERFQESLAYQQLQEQLKKRKTVNEYVKTSTDQQSTKHQQNNKQDKSTDDEKERIKHPYLGGQIDYIR